MKSNLPCFGKLYSAEVKACIHCEENSSCEYVCSFSPKGVVKMYKGKVGQSNKDIILECISMDWKSKKEIILYYQERTGKKGTTLSQILQDLKSEGVIKIKRDGRSFYYKLSDTLNKEVV